MADYIPQSEGQLIIWLNNFKTQLAIHGANLGLSLEAIETLNTAIDTLIVDINAVESAKTTLSNTVQVKNTSKTEGVNLIRSEIAKMKTNNNYTQAIGQALSIISDNTVADLNTMNPSISAEAFPGYVRIKFTKKGFTGVNIYARLKGNQGWNFLSRDTSSPYEDKRPLNDPNIPETREYMAIGLKDDDEIGQQSDIVSIVFGG